MLFGDGSVHFMKTTMNGLPWQQMMTVSGGEIVSSDSY